MTDGPEYRGPSGRLGLVGFRLGALALCALACGKGAPDAPEQSAQVHEDEPAPAVALDDAGPAPCPETLESVAVGAGVRVVPAGELNRSYHSTGNKSLTVWERVLELLQHRRLTLGEAAELMGRSVNAIKKLHARALGELASKLGVRGRDRHGS